MKKRTSRRLSILLVLCMVLALLPGTALAADITYAVPGGNLYFDLTTGTITDCGENVTEAVIPSEISGVPVTSIGKAAFFGCKSLRSVTVPDSVTSIGYEAFSLCSSLSSVTIPDSVTTIEGYAFAGCSSLRSVTIPDGVTSVNRATFKTCSSLSSMTIPDGVTSIGSEAFAECSSLSSVTIPGSVTTIGYSAFWGCNSLSSVTIPDSVTTIDGSAFAGCSGLRSVTIPGSVTTIDSSAVAGCSGLRSVTISDGVTSIGMWAFEGCSSLSSVTIPSSVTSISMGAFQFCESLRDVYYGGSVYDWAEIEVSHDNDPLINATIHYSSTDSAPSPSPSPSPSSSPASSTNPAPSGGISVTVGGKAVAWTDAEPFIDENSRTMVPLRAVADAMSLGVNWDASAREASFTNGTKTIIFPIDSTTARTSDGGTVTMDTAAIIRDGRTYAPIRYLAEYFGYTVGWDAASRTVTIA